MVGSTLTAAAGTAVWLRHGLYFADVGAASVPEVVRATGGPGLVPAFVLTLVALAGLQMLAARIDRRQDRRTVAGLLAAARIGLSLPLAALLLDALSFRCTAGALGTLGVALTVAHGSLAAHDWRRSDGTFQGRHTAGSPASAPRVAVILLAVALPLALVSGWPGASGDEPHYLILAQSMWKDGDLDLAREYDEREHRSYWLSPLSPHTRPGLEPGSRYSIHGVGVALLLVPAFALADIFGADRIVVLARLVQIGGYAAFGLVLYLAAGAVGGRGAAWRAALVALPLLPLVVLPLALFPEPWAMLVACLAFLLLRAPDRLGAALGGGLALACLPWLGLKLIPLAVALAAIATLRSGGALSRGGRIAAAWGPLLLSLIGHGVYTWLLYGSLSPVAIYLGAAVEGAGREPALGSDWRAYVAAWPGAVRTLFGHLLDQKDGLLAVAPHYLLAALGLRWMWRERRGDLLALLVIYAAHALPYALSQELGGQSPPVRPLAPVVWTFAVLAGVGLSRPLRRWAAIVAGALLGVSAWITLRLVLSPELLSHDYSVHVSRLLLSLSSHELALWRWFPLWVNSTDPQWAVTILWTLALGALACALAWRGAPATERRADRLSEAAAAARYGHRAAAAAFGLCTAGALWIAATVPVPAGHEGGAEIAPGVTAWVPGGYPSPAWAEGQGVWVRPGAPREVILRADRPLGTLRVALRPLVPTQVFFALGDARVEASLSPESRTLLTVSGLPGYPDGDGHAYRAILGASDGAAPAQVHGGMDYRVLGVSLRVQ